MIHISRRIIATTLAGLLAAGRASAQAPPASIPPAPGAGAFVADAGQDQGTPGLRETQVAVAVDREGSRRRFRATAIRVEDDALTIVTAAHCISAEDQGWPAALLFERGVVLEGVVEAVTRNPRYRPNQPKEIPGPDNAVARLRFRLDNPKVPARARAEPPEPARAAFRAIRTIPALTTRTYPGPEGQVVDVRMIDGRGVEHAVRAGNHSNPRWLEWGPSYQPIPGDSGGGVVVVRPGPTGQPRPILIGVIVGRDERGGGASLIGLDQPWIAEALKPPPPREPAKAKDKEPAKGS